MTIASGEAKAEVVARISDLLDEWGGIHGGGEPATWGDARAQLNLALAFNNIEDIGAAESGLRARERINELIVATPAQRRLLLDFADDYGLVIGPDGRSGAVGGIVTTQRASGATYFDADGLMQVAGNNVLRLDHDPVTGEALGALIEEQRTNLALHSGDLMNAVYMLAASGNPTREATAEVAPDGVGTFTKVVEGNANGTPILFQRITAAVIPNETGAWYSVFVKAAERTRCLVQHNIFASWTTRTSAVVDLTNGDIISVSGAGSPDARVQYVGDGVYRISIYGVTNASGGNRDFSVGPRLNDATDSTSYQGDGSSGVLAWGYQVEIGDSPSSYIPTEGSQVTRAADQVTIPLSGFPWNGGDGTLTVNGNPAQPVVSGSSLDIAGIAHADGISHIGLLEWMPS